MVNFGKVSELNSKTDFVFASVSDFTSRIGNLSNGRAYTCYCTSDFTNLITSGGSAGTARGFFSKNSNGTTDFLVIVMGNSNIMYSARLNNTGEGVTYNKTFSDDATVLLAAQNTTPPYKIFSSSSNDHKVDEYLDDYSQPYAPHTHYYIALNLAFVHSALGGGDMLIEGYKANENYEWQKATKYDSSGIVSFARSKMNQIWTDWNSKNIS